MGPGFRSLSTALLPSYRPRAVGRPFYQCNTCAKDKTFKCREFAFAELQGFREFVNFAKHLTSGRTCFGELVGWRTMPNNGESAPPRAARKLNW